MEDLVILSNEDLTKKLENLKEMIYRNHFVQEIASSVTSRTTTLCTVECSKEAQNHSLESIPRNRIFNFVDAGLKRKCL